VYGSPAIGGHHDQVDHDQVDLAMLSQIPENLGCRLADARRQRHVITDLLFVLVSVRQPSSCGRR
jgi:hypothetical protein